MDAVGWRIGRVPLPSAIATILSAKEWVDDEGRFRFDVAMATPVMGYRRWRVTARGRGVPQDYTPA